MKRFFLAIISILAAATTGWAASSMYYNNGTVTTPPQIDATNFVNEGVFDISTGLPFEFASVLNFTNRHQMRNGFLDTYLNGIFYSGGFFYGSSGFRFDWASPTNSSRHPAANFFNAPLVGNVASNATVYSDYQLLVDATNIVNRGALRVSQYGLVKLTGKTVDTSRGVIRTSGFGERWNTFGFGSLWGSTAEGIYDDYWYFGTNTIHPDLQFRLFFPYTSIYDITTYSPPYYFTLPNSLYLYDIGTSSLNAREFIYTAGSNRTVQIVFVRNSNPNITTRIVSSGGWSADLGEPIVEWASYHTNSAGVVQADLLYLQDSFGSFPTNMFMTNYPSSPPPPSYIPVPWASFQPYNFSVTRSAPFLLDFANPGQIFTDKPSSFWGTEGPPVAAVTADYSAYGVTVSTTPTPSSAMATVRGASGRVEIQADKSLDVNLAQVEALTYLKLQATNHFAGASNAIISAPFADVALSSTNGFLNMSSVLQPTVSRLSGTIEVYSARWTNNVVFAGGTNSVTFNVILVDSVLTNTTPVQLFDLSLKATAVEIGDTLSVLNSLSLDADRVCITSNGVVNLGTTGIQWDTSAPHLKTLTNNGIISSASTFNFISHNSNGTTRPYDVLANSGSIQGDGITVTAHDFYNQGTISSLHGPLTLQITTNINLPLAGLLSAPEADLNLFCQNLYVTNHNLNVGRKLNLTVTGNLLAGTNNWQVFDGFSLLTRPTNSDLSHVIIRSQAIQSQAPIHQWPGSDRGPQNAGFNNNVAPGLLVLDGAVYSLFTFSGNGASSNALYVDRLELTNSAGLFDPQGSLSELNIEPGMMIYYAQATINGTSAAEFLDGKNNGRLRWVSSHAGPFSGVNVVYPDGSTNFLNAALVASCNLDSDNDGIPNCIDSSPVLLLPGQLTALPVAETSPPALSLSYLTISWATNRFYTATNLKATNWQLFTNFVTPLRAGPPFMTNLIVPLGNDPARFYRVDVLAPSP